MKINKRPLEIPAFLTVLTKKLTLASVVIHFVAWINHIHPIYNRSGFSFLTISFVFHNSLDRMVVLKIRAPLFLKYPSMYRETAPLQSALGNYYFILKSFLLLKVIKSLFF